MENEDLYSFASLLNDSIIIKIYSKYMLVMDNNFNIIS